MENYDNAVASLIQKIENSFPVFPLPPSEQITEHRCDECDMVRDDFAGITWKDLPSDWLQDRVDALSLFTPEAFRYYIPAFLREGLRSYKTNYIAMEFSIYTLGPALRHDSSARLAAIKALFSTEQKAVIISFLEFVLSKSVVSILHNDASRALAYWREDNE